MIAGGWLLAVDDLECLRAGPSLEHAVALGGEVDAQGGDDVLFIVADKNIHHLFLLLPRRAFFCFLCL